MKVILLALAVPVAVLHLLGRWPALHPRQHRQKTTWNIRERRTSLFDRSPRPLTKA